jgi:putative GTP pyrophosphokinase
MWCSADGRQISGRSRRICAVVEEFRKAHAELLTKIAANLRYYVDRYSSIELSGRPIVGQRLKRMRTIVDKLGREPTMALSWMEDMGGCRALFASVL